MEMAKKRFGRCKMPSSGDHESRQKQHDRDEEEAPSVHRTILEDGAAFQAMNRNDVADSLLVQDLHCGEEVGFEREDGDAAREKNRLLPADETRDRKKANHVIFVAVETHLRQAGRDLQGKSRRASNCEILRYRRRPEQS